MAVTKASSKPQAKTTRKTRKPEMKEPVVNTEEFFYEVNDQQVQVNQLDLKQRIYDAYKNDGHRPSNIRSLQVYINLEEKKAYYVINGKAEGKFVEL